MRFKFGFVRANPTARLLAAASVGSVVAFAVGSCASDPMADYLAEARGVVAAAPNVYETPTDQQLVMVGKLICSSQGAGIDPATLGEPGYVAVVLKHCDTLNAAPSPLAAEPTPAPVESDTVPIDDGLTDRGTRPAEVGQRLDSWGRYQSVDQYVTVDSIKPVASCNPRNSADTDDEPVNGHFIAVSYTVQNLPTYDDASGGVYLAGANQWDFVGVDGKAYTEVDNLNAFYCRNVQDRPSKWAPGRTYTITEYMDVPNGGGYLIYGQSPSIGMAYEYSIPAA